jgi:hypothetical protein
LRACSKNGSSEMRTKFCSKKLKERYHLEDLGINGRIILKCILGNSGGGG